MSIFPLLALAGGGAAVALNKGETVEQTQAGSMATAVATRPLLGSKLVGGITIGQIQGGMAAAPGATPPNVAVLAGRSRMFSRFAAGTATFGLAASNASNPVDAQIQAKLDQINAYGSAAYNQLSSDAKKAGAKALSDQLGIDPPLKGDESWETIASVSGAAAGGAVGAYIGGPLGAKLGAMLGAYLGVKLEEVLSQDLDKIGDWFQSKWGDIQGWVSDEAKSIGNDIENYLGSIF